MIKSVNDLWIGDLLKLKKSGLIGKYNGEKSPGKIKVKTDHKTVITTLSNVEIYVENEAEILDLGLDDLPTKDTKPFDPNNKNSIDLHINILAPHLQNQPSVRILDYQVNTFHQFVDEAYNSRKRMVQIIHGKGEGVLRAEIQHLLSTDKRIHAQILTNNGGATNVWFNY